MVRTLLGVLFGSLLMILISCCSSLWVSFLGLPVLFLARQSLFFYKLLISTPSCKSNVESKSIAYLLVGKTHIFKGDYLTNNKFIQRFNQFGNGKW